MRASNAGCDSSTRPLWRRVRRCRLMAGGARPTSRASSPAGLGRSRKRSTTRRGCGSARAARVWSIWRAAVTLQTPSHPPFDLHAAADPFQRLLAADLLDRLADRPVVALRVATAVGAIAVELGRRIGDNHRAGLSRPLAVRVDILGDLDRSQLGVLTGDLERTFEIVVPLLADGDQGVSVAHLAVDE